MKIRWKLDRKLIDWIDFSKFSSTGYLEAVLLLYGIDRVGENKQFLIAAIAQIIVAEMQTTRNADKILKKLRKHDGRGQIKAAPTLHLGGTESDF